MIAPQRSNIVSQKMNKFHFIVFAVVVAALNVLFNAILQRASQRGGSLIEAILSPKFFLAACVGVLSAMSLLAVYRSGANLAQGIILMGALSISFGTVVGSGAARSCTRLSGHCLSRSFFFMRPVFL
jgi:hypothetical protein